jgi:hypothetical protein
VTTTENLLDLPTENKLKNFAYDRSLMDQFFDEHEMATIAVLADIIIPADGKSGVPPMRVYLTS